MTSGTSCMYAFISRSKLSYDKGLETVATFIVDSEVDVQGLKSDFCAGFWV
jgi:hypothetical protein